MAFLVSLGALNITLGPIGYGVLLLVLTAFLINLMSKYYGGVKDYKRLGFYNEEELREKLKEVEKEQKELELDISKDEANLVDLKQR